jgi:RNA polymerase sigma-70 factor (ECF subfamily)
MPKTDRSNEEWLLALRVAGTARDAALADLRAILLAGLRQALRGWVRTSGREFAALAEDFAQEALLLVLKHLDTFRGQSRFTSWAHKIAVRVALTELRRRHWQDVSLDSLMQSGPAQMFSNLAAQRPVAQAERSGAMEMLRRMMAEELTEKQRMALAAVALHGMPLEEAARRLGTNRNALYKLLHDARVRLKGRFARDGVEPQDMMSGFASG